MHTTTKVEYLKREDACAQLGLKERRLRDYVTAGAIRQSEGGLLHAGDVARLQESRNGKKATAQMTAIAKVPSNLTAEQREQLARAAAAVRQAGNGTPATRQIGSGETEQSGNAAIPNCLFLTLDQAEVYTGIPADFLEDFVLNQKLKALNVGVRRGVRGRWRIRRADLDAIEGQLFESGPLPLVRNQE